MEQKGLKLNHITFVAILYACSHAGLLQEGFQFFQSIQQDHGMTPTGDHYLCLVDLLGRAGLLEEAEELLQKIPCQPTVAVWMALLGACRIHGDIRLAEIAAQQVLKLGRCCASGLVLLSNILSTTKS